MLIRTANIAPVLSPLPNTLAILINDILIPILDASSKHIYRSFLAKKQTTPTAKDREKLSAKYHRLTIDWKRVYLLSFRTTLETKLSEFHFKILSRIVFTNEKLSRFDMAESDKCAFCQTEVESIEPLLFSCKISSAQYPKHVLSWLRDNNIIVESLKAEDIIISKFDVGDDFLLESYFIAWEVLYLFRKGQKGMPSLQGFITRTRCVEH